MRTRPDWDLRELVYVDTDLEQVVDEVAYDQLTSQLAAALAAAMAGRPETAMRAWRVLLARMNGQTLDQIAVSEGRSRERIRQILSEIRRIAAAQPNLFAGFGALDHTSRCEALNCRFDSRFWRRGYTNELPKTASLREAAAPSLRAKAIA
ncbi:RNA polymerase subunit sigma-70 [Mycobacteroides abscessus]|uniref:RNA polymerase subunit sigma-70 n=1 Tax=Mycobacteroides abscessus TaxID=36809 RepID=A0ABD7HM27_9MYCO|nr:RNA polymerase subunit sigma-70 [Mycobacteroides abscessus]RIT36730.1 RNA polymerase subunit sigma-70 [Mycobacteroides abscessus]